VSARKPRLYATQLNKQLGTVTARGVRNWRWLYRLEEEGGARVRDEVLLDDARRIAKFAGCVLQVREPLLRVKRAG
jgi:hypothetical protein